MDFVGELGAHPQIILYFSVSPCGLIFGIFIHVFGLFHLLDKDLVLGILNHNVGAVGRFEYVIFRNRPDRVHVAKLAEHWASIPKVVGSIPTVARHIFQACPAWI